MRCVFESLIVFGVVTGILLPVRLLFVEYVSDDWFGSFGVISVISISLIVLVEKKKLGLFGLMFSRQMQKFQKGKRRLLVFGESALVLLMLGGMIFAIDQGNSVYQDLKISNIESASSDSVDDVIAMADDLDSSDWLMGFLMSPVMFFTSFPQMSANIASIDQSLNGWPMHFYTVGFVEYLEVLGILIFYQFRFKKNIATVKYPVAYTKIAVRRHANS